MKNAKRGESAFTLVEIIVVLAIILTLAALLLPVLASAKDRAKQSDSAERLRQIAIASTLYAHDYDDVLCFYRNDELFLRSNDPEVTMPTMPTNSQQPKKLVEAVGVYAKSNAIWFCMSDPYAHKPSGWGRINHLYSSYMYWALPKNYTEANTPEFPLVTSFSTIDTRLPLYSEPFELTENGRVGYWQDPLVGIDVMADTHIVHNRADH